VKPDPRIFETLFERYAIDPKDAVYVDDHDRNVETARRLGMRGIQFTGAESLRRELGELRLL
jgi:2-haloacid dehalogenase